MVELTIATVSIFLLVLGWIIRLEKKLTEIQTNITWIMKNIEACRQP